MTRRFLEDNLEAWVWTCALVWLACSDPVQGAHFTICPLRNLGLDFCPGCGLGNAVSYALHGQLAASLQHHLLGIPAIIVLGARVFTLVKEAIHRYTKTNHVTIR